VGAIHPRTSRIAYTPQLDGLRAVAIVAVMLYHGGISWAGGGFLGVDVFFVLSGFLITTLLVREWNSRGSVSLSGFWLRRARRLLPALLVMLLAVCAYASFLAPASQLSSIRGDALSTLAYVANWHQIIANQGYFAQADATSPLLHTWSLGIEEQFYLVWPLVIVTLVMLRKSLRLCLAVALVGCAFSAVEMALLFHPGVDPSRLYYGTDTRAQSLLLGAALALFLAVAPSASKPSIGKWLQPLGLVAAAGFAYMVVAVNSNTYAMYRGGFLLAAVLVALIIWAVVAGPRSPLAASLSLGVVVYIGRISYGLYLWHWPVDVAIDESRTGLSGWPLFFVRTGVAVGLAIVSFHLLEHPIREKGLGGYLGFKRHVERRAFPVALAAVTVTVFAIFVAMPVATTSPASQALKPTAATLIHDSPVRLLLVGDSMAEDLGENWQSVAAHYGIALHNSGLQGCGLTPTGEVMITGRVQTDEMAAFVPVPCANWPELWAEQTEQLHPEVAAMLFGPFEIRDHLLHGQWVHIGMPVYDRLEVAHLERAVSILSSHGAKVVFLTSPYFNEGEQLDGSPWPEDNPKRVDRWNTLLREVAARHPGTVTVIDLGGHLSPGGRFADEVHGVAVRSPINIHITQAGALYLAPWLFPQIVKLVYPSG
jgi:peptidoglycan/LPS O-acetylase OafA/YrhL